MTAYIIVATIIWIAISYMLGFNHGCRVMQRECMKIIRSIPTVMETQQKEDA